MPHYHVKSDQEYKEAFLTNPDGIVIVKFSASWCGPCRMIAPHFARHAAENDDITFISVDIESCPAVTKILDVTSLPTFVVFKRGDIQEEFFGADRTKLSRIVQKYINEK